MEFAGTMPAGPDNAVLLVMPRRRRRRHHGRAGRRSEPDAPQGDVVALFEFDA